MHTYARQQRFTISMRLGKVNSEDPKVGYATIGIHYAVGWTTAVPLLACFLYQCHPPCTSGKLCPPFHLCDLWEYKFLRWDSVGLTCPSVCWPSQSLRGRVRVLSMSWIFCRTGATPVSPPNPQNDAREKQNDCCHHFRHLQPMSDSHGGSRAQLPRLFPVRDQSVPSVGMASW